MSEDTLEAMVCERCGERAGAVLTPLFWCAECDPETAQELLCWACYEAAAVAELEQN